LFDALKLKGKAAIPTLNEILKADFAHSDDQLWTQSGIEFGC
jgi:hypothetical protein